MFLGKFWAVVWTLSILCYEPSQGSWWKFDSGEDTTTTTTLTTLRASDSKVNATVSITPASSIYDDFPEYEDQNFSPEIIPTPLSSTTTDQSIFSSTLKSTRTPTIKPSEPKLHEAMSRLQEEIQYSNTIEPTHIPAINFPSHNVNYTLLHEEYIERSQNILQEFLSRSRALKDELDYRKYLVAMNLFTKTQELLNSAQEKLSQLLSNDCRSLLFSHFRLERSSEQMESCNTSRDEVDEAIDNFNMQILAYQDYQRGVHAFNNLAQGMQNLHQVYNHSLQNAIGGDNKAQRFKRLTRDREAVKIRNNPESLNLALQSIQTTTESPPIQTKFSASSSIQISSEIKEPEIIRQFEEIENNRDLSARERMDKFKNLINQTEGNGIEGSPDIFTLAVLIKNCREHQVIVPHLKIMFPAAVVRIVWNEQIKMLLIVNQTKYKIFADSEYKVQHEEILNDNNSSSLIITGETWKLIPSSDVISFLIYNIQRNAVLKAVKPAEHSVLEFSVDVTMEDVKDRDVTLLQRKPEYLWTLKLVHCNSTKEEVATVEKISHSDQKCFVTIENKLYTYLALNVNKSGYLNLEMREEAADIEVKSA